MYGSQGYLQQYRIQSTLYTLVHTISLCAVMQPTVCLCFIVPVFKERLSNGEQLADLIKILMQWQKGVFMSGCMHLRCGSVCMRACTLCDSFLRPTA